MIVSMGFEGKLATLSFADLIQLLASTNKTGTLHMSQGETWKKIYLRNGLVVALSSNDPQEYVSYALVALGKVSEEDMARAVLRQPQEGKLVGKILVDEGKLEPEVLQRYLADKAYEMVAKLMNWTEAEFRFEEFALPKSDFLPLDLPVEQLLMEGFRRADELSRFREQIPDDEVVLELCGESDGIGDTNRTVVLRMIRELDRPRSVRELKRKLHTSEFSLLQALSGLLENGVLKLSEKPASTVPPPPPTWLVDARKLLMAGFTDRAIDVLRAGLSAAPDDAEGRGLLLQAENRFVRDVTRKELPFEAFPQPLVTLEQISGRDLKPAEAFVLSRVTGAVDVAAILESVPLPMAECLLILKRLQRDGLIKLQAQPNGSG